ncbi:MAG: YIP1 family protein [Acidimicrobiia bacterium]|nr:YIP1 family protein [Acidimicrobiia bacterium]
MDFAAIWSRVLRAVKLEPELYREVADDDAATGQAFVVAIGAALIGGFGTMLISSDSGVGGWLGGAIIGAPIGLVIFSAIALGLGKLFSGQGSFNQLLRGLGFAVAPNALGIIPILGGIVGGIWMIACAVVGVREIHKISTGAAVAVVLIPVAIVFAALFFLIVILIAALAGGA